MRGEAKVIHFWNTLALGVLIITGIWTCFGQGMVMGELADWMEDRFPQWVTKPLFACPPCMSSVHGTWIWFTLNGPVEVWPIYVLALCGAMKLIAHNLLKNG